MFRFSLYKIAQILTPPHLRKPRFISWIKVFVSYLEYILEQQYRHWERTMKEAIMTPQIIYLEWLLNNRFGTTTIQIVEGFNLGPWIFPHLITVDPEFYLDQADSWVYTNNDAVTVDFVVNVPDSLTDQTAIIAALVQKFKLPGMTFIIQLIAD